MATSDVKRAAWALGWELWRKNRWGFIVLLVLLFLCSALGGYTAHLASNYRRLAAEFETVSRGAITGRELLPMNASETGAVSVRVKVGGDIIYSGALSPTDVLSWHGEVLNSTVPGLVVGNLDTDLLGRPREAFGGLPMFQVTLNGNPVFAWTQMPTLISVSVFGGGKRTISLAAAFECAEKVGAAASSQRYAREQCLIIATVCMCFSALVLFAMFGWAEPHAQRGFTGMPPRLFTLPVSTGALVAWPVTFGTAAMILTCLAWFGLVFPVVGSDGQVPRLYLTLLSTAGLTWFQALVWGLPSFPKTRVVALTTLMLALVFGVGIGMEAANNSALPRNFELAGSAIFSGLWACGAIAAWIGVKLERQGTWNGWVRSINGVRLASKIWVRPRAFNSALRAQFWLEWRRNGRAALWVWAAIVWVGFGGDLVVRGWFPQTQGVSSGFALTALLAALAWVPVVGLNLARDGGSKKLAMSSFTAVRPLTSGALFQSKLMVGAALWIGAVGIFAASAAVWSLAVGQEADFPDLAVAVIIGLAVSLHVFVGILPLCLSGRIPGFPWSLLPLLLIYGVIFNGATWLIRLQDNQNGLYRLLTSVGLSNLLLVLLAITLLAKLAIGIWAFRRAVTRRITSLTFAIGCLVVWAALAWFLVEHAWDMVEHGQLQSPPEMLTLAIGAILIVPLARLGLSPLALTANRHR